MMRSLAIVGPTASGKTALSLELAERLSGEIISCDSMQIYRGMDIGTAKATAEEQARAVHHLIDVVDPSECFSVEAYRSAAMSCAGDITSRGRLPIFTGGTGLYLDSLLRAPQADAPESDPEYRDNLIRSAGENYQDVLWERLRSVDPESAEKIHKNNVKRVIRALEIYDKCGVPKSELDRRSHTDPPEIGVCIIALDFHDRELLYSRIDRRVDLMMDEGLFGEVSGLYSSGVLKDGTTASQAIGYKEIAEHLRGECTLHEAVEKIKLASRRYAKRQLTWFRHTDGVHRLFVDSGDGRIRNLCDIAAEASEIAEEYIRGGI